MLHRCENCPGLSGLEDFIRDKISDEVDNITYKQWVSTDRTTLSEHVASVSDYVDTLVAKVDKLAAHHFISKHQSSYLRELKENISDHECIMLLDFAENYSFMVQDAAQGFHWDHSQCTLHPFAVYYRSTNNKGDPETKCLSICVISDCLKHDTASVHTFLSHVIPYVRSICTSLTKVIYFSDGAASQYKNHKNFTNLLHHSEDFGVLAEWHFFATSHGKSPCDGIGGTVKRGAARASLQATTEKHILTPTDLFNWADKNIKNVHFIWVGKGEVEKNSTALYGRFASSSTVPGTRDNHSFVPVGSTRLQVSRVSGQPGFTVDVTTGRNIVEDVPGLASEESAATSVTLQDMVPGTYITCMYDRQWWVGNIKDVSEEEQDVQVRFMHPNGPARSFTWPRKEDICWVPLCHVLKQVDAPVTSTGRRYSVPDDTQKAATDLLKLMK